MTSVEPHNVRRNTILSAFSLFFQSGYSAVLGLVANLVITILLSPKIYGIYITTLSLIAFLNYFSDIGLAASLIQKKEIDDDDLSTTFTIQQFLIITLISVGFLLSIQIQLFYKLPQEGVYLFWALLMSFFISSLKTIPSIFLERKIQYQKIVLVQIVENTVFYLAVICFAFAGFDLNSFTIAVVLRAVVGLVVIYTISPWMPRIGFSKKSFSQLISFGLPFQASSFLALFKDDLITLYLGKVIGFEAVGYIGWAKKWAEAPIRIIMDNVTKVLFPVIAHFQEEHKKIGSIIEKVFYYQTALLAPIMVSAALLMSSVVEIIPKYHKWASALPIFYIFVVSSFFVTFYSPLINVLNAKGRVKITFAFMAVWTIIMWTGTTILTKLFGVYGFPITHLIVSSTFFIVVKMVQKDIPFSLIKPTYKFIVAAACMGIGIFATQMLLSVNSYLIFVIAGSVGVCIYILVIRYVFRVRIMDEFRFLIRK